MSYSLNDMTTGQTEIVGGEGARFADVACAFHAGVQIMSEDDEKNPIFSTAVGFQPDCINCVNQASLTIQHINAVENHDQATKDEYGFSARDGKEQEAVQRERLGL